MDQTDPTRPDPARDLDPLRSLAEAALAHQETAQRQQADMQASGRPRPDRQGEAPTTPSPAEAQQLAEHLTLDDSPPSGRPPPEHLRHTFATWLQHGGIPRPGHRRADEHAGDRPTARDGAARAA